MRNVLKGQIVPLEELLKSKLDSTHVFNVTPKDRYLIKNKKSNYVVIISSNAKEREKKAASELVHFLKLSTGVNLKLIKDNEYKVGSFISIGNTSLSSKEEFPELSRSSYIIKTIGENLFLLGGGDYGTLYSVYELLCQLIDFDVFQKDEIFYKKSSELLLPDFDILDVPDFEYRIAAVKWPGDEDVTRDRMRFTSGEVWMGPNDLSWHNTFAYIPPEKWKKEHPKWFSDDGKQLCFNAHGDNKEFKLFFKEFMKSFIDVVEAHPDIDNITITQQDISVWCRCPVCKADYEKYGTDSGTMIKFCNKVSIALEKYFKEKGIKRRVNICFFAYHMTTDAPARKKEDGTYELIDKTVLCRDNVYCFYAPIFSDFMRGYNNTHNEHFIDTLNKWCTVSPHIYLWIYATRFQDYFTPYNAMQVMQETYIVAKQHGADYLYDQCQWNNNDSADWMHLRTYLESKLAWNVKANQDELTAKFMEKTYKNAAKSMEKALQINYDWFAYLLNERDIPGTYTDDKPVNADNYPKEFVDNMLNAFDEAYKDIECLKEKDKELYTKLYDRICLETLTYRYMDIAYHGDKMDKSTLLKKKLAFKEDAIRLNISLWCEWKDISLLWREWGVDDLEEKNVLIKNPLSHSNYSDPFITYDKKTGYYYFLASCQNNKMAIFRSKHLNNLITKCDYEVVYECGSGDIYGPMWAPEMYKIGDRWFIFTSCQEKYNSNFFAEQKRLLILKSKTEDPFDGFEFYSKPDPSLFAIDPTFRIINGKYYICYSKVADGRQVLEIRELDKNLRFTNNFGVIAEAELDWEKVKGYDVYTINEGAFFLERNGKLFIVYSANGCWSDDYCLGLLEFMGGDLIEKKNWKKHPKPLFKKGNNVYGVGHAAFFESPDNKEVWCVYHCLLQQNPSLEETKRYTSVQKIEFNDDNIPIMGDPLEINKEFNPPSGETK